jgi:uncharacterized membrane protein
MRSILAAVTAAGTLLACQAAEKHPVSDSVALTSPVSEYWIAGTEPFWAIHIDSIGIRYTTPEDTAGRWFPLVAPASKGDTLRWAGAAGKDSFDIVIWKSTCSDGMSDREWSHTAVVKIAGQDHRGCARP